ncbi:colicin immunity protein/pyocin immunity protein [Promicromonospora sp. AC04]|uniref:bacteriocin immunity protein n=1 Tax=Promicromonospora sp. AC04 TaxID=2135723 RepID=UPI000D374845|nr:bacteriocin immunity protein [Promicromonospora sp. AC04]PUB23954.1 colicin immunity protein/pyocin immunity protein [Promicromonospora sp. AC04]
MRHETSRDELLALVRYIMAGMPGASEHEASLAVAQFRAAVPDPNGTDLIFYPSHAFDHEPTAEEIVERALSYRPFQM